MRVRNVATLLLAASLVVALTAVIAQGSEPDTNWYERSFWLLHEDHHTVERHEVGRDADFDETARLVGLSKPDLIQIHAKGNPGWTTYPTKIGHTPPRLARDVLAIWRDVARRDGYHFSAYYNIGRDGVIMQRHPEWNRSRADGKEWERSLCYHSGVAEEYLWPMLREIMTEYRPEGWWLDGTLWTVHLCYCDHSRARVKKKTGLEAPAKSGEEGWSAYHEMQRQIFREFVHKTAKMIHEIDPKCLVAVNWAYSLRMPEKPDEGIAYLTGDHGNRVEGLSADAHWYDSQQLPFDLVTRVGIMPGLPWIDGVTAALQMGPKPDVQIQQEMAIIVANGGRYGAWDTPTPESGIIAQRFEFMAEVVAPFLRNRQRWCLGSDRVPEASLLHSAAAHYALIDGSTACFGFAGRNNRIKGAAEVLPRLHLNYEMIPDWRLLRQDVRSPLLIVEHPKTLTKQTVDNLVEFIRGGGTLLMTGMGIDGDVRLREVFGIANVIAPGGSEPLSADLGGKRAEFSHWLHRLGLSTATELLQVRDTDDKIHPMLPMIRYGLGQAFYVPIPLLSKHGDNVVPDDLLRLVFDKVLPPDKRLLTTDAPDTVEVVLRRKGDDHILHLVNMAPGSREVVVSGKGRYRRITGIPPAPACHVSVRLPAKPTTVHLQPAGVELEGWRFENGRLEADLPKFKIHQMVVMKLRRQ